MKLVHLIVIAALFASANACSTKQPDQTKAAEPALLEQATIKDIMDSMVDPSSDFIFESVASIADEHGITEKAPQTDEEWQEVRRRGLVLVEAPNLLVMNGRKVAPLGVKSENPDIELGPEEIQKLLDADRPSFLKHARALQDAGMQVLHAADTKNRDALFEAGETIDTACENCHLQYWYPNDKAAQEAAKANAQPEKK
jgi:cytochrome c556